MSPLTTACIGILNQLESMVSQLKPEDFVRPTRTLSGSSLGQHIRHTIEFFLCLQSGIENGIVNYDKRRHDKQLETNHSLALAALVRVRYFITSQKSNEELKFEAAYSQDETDGQLMATNYFRELAYNVEHAVHHMALIKIGVHEIAPYVTLSETFGVAASTIKHIATTNISPMVNLAT